MIEPELEEALRFHGISKDKMDYELIKWLGSVKLENPMVYSYIIKDDARVQDYIKQWDFVVSTGITVDYPKRRGWDSFMALREFVQNALDVEDKLFGYENIMVDVNVVEHEHMIKITDRGPGIEFDAFKVGASSKGCADRGYFGEGLKVALAYLVGTGRPVYIFNKRRQVFKPCVVPGSDIVLLAIGRHRTVVPGTMVRIYNWFETEDVSYMVFQTWLKSHAIGKDIIVWRKDTMKPNCQINRPNFIVKNVNNVPVNKLWDISEEFERALTKVSGVIVKALYEDGGITLAKIPNAAAAFSRAKRGAWNASYRKIPALDTIVTEQTAPRTFWTINHYAPAVVAVDSRAVMSAEYTENSFIADEDWCLTRFIGQDIVIPSKEVYFDICRKYVFPKLRKIAMDRGWEKAMVYLYDPWNDTYVYDKAYIVSELPVE
jgi:hypothetical protein